MRADRGATIEAADWQACELEVAGIPSEQVHNLNRARCDLLQFPFNVVLADDDTFENTQPESMMQMVKSLTASKDGDPGHLTIIHILFIGVTELREAAAIEAYF